MFIQETSFNPIVVRYPVKILFPCCCIVNVNENDRDYLRFVWFINIFLDQPKIVRNCFARVVFLVTSSPFCLNGTIRKQIQSYDFDKEFIDKAFSSFFVDDFIGGEESVTKGFVLFKKLRIRFLEGQMENKQFRITEFNYS